MTGANPALVQVLMGNGHAYILRMMMVMMMVMIIMMKIKVLGVC